jgi:biopolymer transport protein ExbD
MFSRKKNETPSIPTSSMADIAFLLLIFFLVATVIDVDTGIGLTLPEYTEETPPPASPERLAAILINANNEISLDNEITSLSLLKDKLKKRIYSKIDLPKNKKLIVSVKTDRRTMYNEYIFVLDQVKMAFYEVRDEYSNQQFGDNFSDLSYTDKETVKSVIPIIISIAEPE